MCNINGPIGGNYMKRSKEEVKKSLVMFATKLAEGYNEQLGCFLHDHEDIMEEFEQLLDNLED